jgi:tetratricopeptide (TPR) repeat protein
MPNHSPSLVLAAAAYISLNDAARGKALLEKAISVDPSNLQAYEIMGRLLAAQGQLDSARAQFEQLSKRNPTAAGPRTMLGMVLELQNKRDAASKEYEEALRLDSKAAVAANNLATYYADNGERLDIALELAQTAVRELPEHASAADTLGWVYIKRDLPALALEPLRRATQMDPKNAIFQYHLGLAYAKSGDKVRAKDALKKALTLQADFPGADDAKRALSTL